MVSTIWGRFFIFTTIWGKISNLTHIFQKKEAMRPTGLGEVNETAKERPHWDGQNVSNGSGMPWEGSSASTLSQIMDKYIIRDPSDNVPNFPEESVLRSQSAVEVACGQHAMIQPLQRNWRWFHEQREQRAYSAFLEFLLTCFYLHSLKVSQLEKESQEQRERCKMLSSELENANNLHRTSLKSLKDVLEETVLRWKSFGIPECDVEVHATDSGQFLPPTYLPMTPRDSNNLKAKDRADSIKKERLSDASTTMRNASVGKRGRRKQTSLFFLRKRTKWGKCIYQLKAEKPRQLKSCSSSRENELEKKPMQIAELEREASQLTDESECQTSNTKIQCQPTEDEPAETCKVLEMPWEGSSASTLSQIMDKYIIRDPSDNVPNFPEGDCEPQQSLPQELLPA